MRSLRTQLAVGPVLLCLLTAHGAMGRPAQVPSPLTVVADQPAGLVTTLQLDRGRYDQLRQVDDVMITAFPLDADTQVDLDLTRFEILSHDAQVIVHTAFGPIEVPPPDLVLLRGTVAGRPGSRVFLALTPRGTNGYIRLDGDQYVIAGARPGDARPTVISHLESLPEGAMGIAPFVCGTDALPRIADDIIDGAVAGAASGSCGFEAEIAIETDFEFTDAFKGDIEASGAYALTLIGAVSEIYLTEDTADNDVGVTLLVSHLSLWDCNEANSPCAYPWTANTANDQLDEFIDYWNVNMIDVPRTTAHFLSTRPYIDAGGVAYLGVLCHPDLAYGLSGHLNGSFPEPLIIEGDSQNWDVLVVAHELGHNFGAPHTHAVAPPIDLCAFGECIVDPDTMTVEGTIMSYCHLCLGGLVNVNLFFHDRMLDEQIHPYLATNPCALSLENIQIVNQPLSQIVCTGDLVTLSVTATANVPLTFQWRMNGVDIPNATNPNFLIAPFGADDVGVYDVVVIGECSSLVSNLVFLLIDDCICESIVITGQPASQIICEGDDVIFTSSVNTNVPVTYQWRKNNVNIPGATGGVYQIAAVDVTDAGTYDVIVTGPCTTAQSSPAQLTVDTDPSCNPNGDVCEGCFTIGDGVFVSTTSDNAPNLDQTTCAIDATIPEWLCYTPSCTGNATASLCGSPATTAFFTTLAVFNSCGGVELACDAGSCGIHSVVTWDVEAGVTYYIRVSGLEGADGAYILDMTCSEVAPCPADLDGDGNVGINDFLDLLGQWGTDPGGPPDFDGDGDVGINDFLFLLGEWGPC